MNYLVVIDIGKAFSTSSAEVIKCCEVLYILEGNCFGMIPHIFYTEVLRYNSI